MSVSSRSGVDPVSLTPSRLGSQAPERSERCQQRDRRTRPSFAARPFASCARAAGRRARSPASSGSRRGRCACGRSRRRSMPASASGLTTTSARSCAVSAVRTAFCRRSGRSRRRPPRSQPVSATPPPAPWARPPLRPRVAIHLVRVRAHAARLGARREHGPTRRRLRQRARRERDLDNQERAREAQPLHDARPGAARRLRLHETF